MKRRNQPDLFQSLKKKRGKIDLIDGRLLTLLNQRLGIALEIGKMKKEMGEKVYDPKREKEILKRLKAKNKGLLPEIDLKKIFKTIMKVSRTFQLL